ncbi:MAG: hypothetical protein JXM70_06855 [Pirellulales bacterium]|nr:hypothetical protein [Pirellulales bacterium]
MNLDWQNIVAPLVVSLAALTLLVRAGIFSRKKKSPRELGCWACLKCRKPPDSMSELSGRTK